MHRITANCVWFYYLIIIQEYITITLLIVNSPKKKCGSVSGKKGGGKSKMSADRIKQDHECLRLGFCALNSLHICFMNFETRNIKEIFFVKVWFCCIT